MLGGMTTLGQGGWPDTGGGGLHVHVPLLIGYPTRQGTHVDQRDEEPYNNVWIANRLLAL
jgi:hypothetical protein